MEVYIICIFSPPTPYFFLSWLSSYLLVPFPWRTLTSITSILKESAIPFMNNNSRKKGCAEKKKNPENYVRRDSSRSESWENHCSGHLGWNSCGMSVYIDFSHACKISKWRFSLEGVPPPHLFFFWKGRSRSLAFAIVMGNNIHVCSLQKLLANVQACAFCSVYRMRELACMCTLGLGEPGNASQVSPG